MRVGAGARGEKRRARPRFTKAPHDDEAGGDEKRRGAIGEAQVRSAEQPAVDRLVEENSRRRT